MFLGFKDSFLSLKLYLVFTDKEASKINAIRNVFEVDESLCLWNMKRSIKKKVKIATKNGVLPLNEAEKTMVFGLIDAHFFHSTEHSSKVVSN